ncbi:ankyrin repeat domain-containing protein [Planotetraspora kaengkrachanensis]|uniref:Ankyrin repeat domain-containing protein n=1 Tax=Planotetraspora kaengkrachanensis TaxID=575193 RepID=A0A8J3PX45_9ACTN|nr:ankyrin repeat domain-containing protein [Planotetraspora kaengkrachanensis]GIG82734.1 hypothetical protein Pka01_58610 [Planotetraspora kaengkrachanensis]
MTKAARGTRSFRGEEAAAWQRVRRHAVPRWMIEQATERRLAGDWRGACAVAGVDVAFDPAAVAERHGAEVAAAVEDDLAHFAPDLLRWHLPRTTPWNGTLAVGRIVVLAEYRTRLGGPGPALYVTTPPVLDGTQRLTLHLGRPDAKHDARRWRDGRAWLTSRHLWDVRHAGELRLRVGGGERAPFFTRDGRLLAEGDLPAADPGRDDPVAHAEWVTLLHERGQVEAALAAAGIHLDRREQVVRGWAWGSLTYWLETLPLNLAMLERETAHLAEATGERHFEIVHGFGSGVALERASGEGTLRVSTARAGGGVRLPDLCWRRPPDLDLLRHGRITADRLHPLVSAALFPDLAPGAGPAGPPDPEPPAPVRVRCRGEWHLVSSGEGVLRMPHSDAERRRERAMRAFGGAVAGCFAVGDAWTSGRGRLPKELRRQRRDLFRRVQYGDTPGVLRMLDAGMDPHVRDGDLRTLLHGLASLDHVPLLPRLLEAGVDLEARDDRGRTPLMAAVYGHGPEPLVRALLNAGARTDVVDVDGWSLSDVIRRTRRGDLRFLRDQVDREHPGIGRPQDDW